LWLKGGRTGSGRPNFRPLGLVAACALSALTGCGSGSGRGDGASQADAASRADGPCPTSRACFQHYQGGPVMEWCCAPGEHCCAWNDPYGQAGARCYSGSTQCPAMCGIWAPSAIECPAGRCLITAANGVALEGRDCLEIRTPANAGVCITGGCGDNQQCGFRACCGAGTYCSDGGCCKLTLQDGGAGDVLLGEDGTTQDAPGDAPAD